MRTLKIEELELVAGADTENSKSKCNNGLGNGDQLAPGNSYENNAAENSLSGPNGSGKRINPNDCRGD